MSYGREQQSPTTPPALSPEQPVDDAVASLLSTIHRKGRGFVLDLANEGEKRTVEVRESLPPHDEFIPQADWRSHVLSDAPSLVAWVKKYGTQEKSIVFIDEKKAVAVLDDTIERGDREAASVDWRASEDWSDWSKLVNGGTLAHKELHRFLMVHEHNLENPELLIALGSVRSTATVDHNSDIADGERTIGVVFKSTAGESLTKFPKMFGITLPVLDADVDSGQFKVAKLKVEVVMPTEPMKPILFRLYCSTWESIWRERIRQEESQLRRELEGWLVLNGQKNYAKRPVIMSR